MKTNNAINPGKSKVPNAAQTGNRQNKDELDSREGEEQLIRGDKSTNNKKPERNSGKKAKRN